MSTTTLKKLTPGQKNTVEASVKLTVRKYRKTLIKLAST